MPFAPEGKKGRPPFAVEARLRIHLKQQWFTLSDPSMEEALHDVPLFREFAGMGWDSRLLDESTILRFRHLLERHKLAEQILVVVNDLLSSKGLLLRAGTVVDATLIAAPSSTKNKDGQRDPEMHQSKKGNEIDALVDQIEKLKASVRAKVEHPFRVIKRQFGHVKVR
jgi:IS5 family transposase